MTGLAMSNALGLQDLLLKVTGLAPAVDQIILELDLFADRYSDGSYQLANEADLKPHLLERVLKDIFPTRSQSLPTCNYVGVGDLYRDRGQQLRVYRAIRRLPLSVLLEQHCSYPGRVAEQFRFDQVPSLMRRALGVHRLEEALDPLIGRDFAGIALENIVAAWCHCCYALMAKDHGRISKFFVLARALQDVLPLGREDGPDSPWICLVNRSAGQVITL
jgi:hypothetical protein